MSLQTTHQTFVIRIYDPIDSQLTEIKALSKLLDFMYYPFIQVEFSMRFIMFVQVYKKDRLFVIESL